MIFRIVIELLKSFLLKCGAHLESRIIAIIRQTIR